MRSDVAPDAHVSRQLHALGAGTIDVDGGAGKYGEIELDQVGEVVIEISSAGAEPVVEPVAGHPRFVGDSLFRL